MVNVEKFLRSKNIKYTLHKHKAVLTCEQAEKYCGHIPGLPCKNLLLKGKESGRYFLVVTASKKQVNFKKICEIANNKKIIFASKEELKIKLGLDVGAVSPFGLLNDTNNEVEVYIDREVYNASIVSFHPNINTATLELTGNMFRKFLKIMKNKITIY